MLLLPEKRKLNFLQVQLAGQNFQMPSTVSSNLTKIIQKYHKISRLIIYNLEFL